MLSQIRLSLITCFMCATVPLQADNHAELSVDESFELTQFSNFQEAHTREILFQLGTQFPSTTSTVLNNIDHNSLFFGQQKTNDAQFYARFVQRRTRELLPKRFRQQSHQIAKAIVGAANRHQMDPVFLMAVIHQESRFNPRALGRHGEIGLMQIKPSTAIWLLSRQGRSRSTKDQIKRELLNPAANIHLGALYLSYLRQTFRGKSRSYISAYNMGAQRVRAHLKNGIQPTLYTNEVLKTYISLKNDIESNSFLASRGSEQAVARIHLSANASTLDEWWGFSR